MEPLSKPGDTSPVTTSGESSPTSPPLKRTPKGTHSLSDLDKITENVAHLKISNSDSRVNYLEGSPTPTRKYLKASAQTNGPVGLNIDPEEGISPASKRRANESESESPSTKKPNSN